MKEKLLLSLSISVVSLGHAALACADDSPQSNSSASTTQVQELPKVDVTAQEQKPPSGYATNAQYHTKDVDLGPLGIKPLQDIATSITVVPEQLITNVQAQTVNDILRYLPSVEIRDQQGLEVSRPQSRGFQGTIVQNVRLDGLNAIGTTAIPGENLSGIEVLNGMAGSLYGPETPAGVFNYMLKRPTDDPTFRYIESFNSDSVFTEQMDAGGHLGDNHQFGYRVNLVHGEGESYVDNSSSNRSLYSVFLDYHLDDHTVVEAHLSHYRTDVTGLPGSIVYDSGKSTLLPRAVDPTIKGLGQVGAGTDLMTNTGMLKIRHDFGNGWDFVAGVLRQNAIRNLFGITNTFVDNSGDYNVTKNFTAVPHFTVTSNLAQLNGHFDIDGLLNDFSIGTNGFNNGMFNYRNSIATPLGSGNINNPTIFDNIPPVPYNGGQYRSGELDEQSIILGDTLHLNELWASQLVLNSSHIHSISYNATGKVTSEDSRDGVLSPTVSVIFKPIPVLTTYVTYSNSLEEGEAAPAGTANANQFMAPYHDEQYEVGAKYAVSPDFLVTLAGFRMTRPLADTNAVTNIFSVVGTQKNNGVELFAQGSITPELSILGGVSYIDARLLNTGVIATNDKLVVGVPREKGDISLDYHPDFAHGFALTGSLHLESKRAATNINNTYAPGYATIDVGARYSWPIYTHFLTVRGQILNATDTHYYSSVADGNIVGSPGANTAYFGAPRTYMASLEFDL